MINTYKFNNYDIMVLKILIPFMWSKADTCDHDS